MFSMALWPLFCHRSCFKRLISLQTTPPFSLFPSDALPSSIDLSKADIRWGLVRAATQME